MHVHHTDIKTRANGERVCAMGGREMNDLIRWAVIMCALTACSQHLPLPSWLMPARCRVFCLTFGANTTTTPADAQKNQFQPPQLRHHPFLWAEYTTHIKCVGVRSGVGTQPNWQWGTLATRNAILARGEICKNTPHAHVYLNFRLLFIELVGRKFFLLADGAVLMPATQTTFGARACARNEWIYILSGDWIASRHAYIILCTHLNDGKGGGVVNTFV